MRNYRDFVIKTNFGEVLGGDIVFQTKYTQTHKPTYLHTKQEIYLQTGKQIHKSQLILTDHVHTTETYHRHTD